MKKTSIYLEPGLDIELAELARERGITKAELIRRSLEKTVRARPRTGFAAIGVGASDGDGTISVEHDRVLAEILGERHATR
jgi:predicted transcriptional regulator